MLIPNDSFERVADDALQAVRERDAELDKLRHENQELRGKLEAVASFIDKYLGTIKSAKT